jgi:hypothetical protein
VVRNPHAFSTFLLFEPSGRTISCGRCGDSFTGDPANGRAWLRAHGASEHDRRAHSDEPPADRVSPDRQPLPAATLAASTSQP